MSIAVVVIIVIIIIIISQFQSTGKLPEFLGSNCGGRWGRVVYLMESTLRRIWDVPNKEIFCKSLC